MAKRRTDRFGLNSVSQRTGGVGRFRPNAVGHDRLPLSDPGTAPCSPTGGSIAKAQQVLWRKNEAKYGAPAPYIALASRAAYRWCRGRCRPAQPDQATRAQAWPSSGTWSIDLQLSSSRVAAAMKSCRAWQGSIRRGDSLFWEVVEDFQRATLRVIRPSLNRGILFMPRGHGSVRRKPSIVRTSSNGAWKATVAGRN